MKVYRGSRGISIPILNLRIRWTVWRRQKISLRLALGRPEFSAVTIPTTQSRFATPVYTIRLYVRHVVWFVCVSAVFTSTDTWPVLITDVAMQLHHYYCLQI